MTVEKPHCYDFFDFRLDAANARLLKSGDHVQLSPKAFQILEMLVENTGRTTTKEDIFNKLWPDNFVEDGNLTQHIHVLRKALGKRPDGQPFIETVPKRGYRFTLLPHEVEAVPTEPIQDAAEASHAVGALPDHACQTSGSIEEPSPARSGNGQLELPDESGESDVTARHGAEALVADNYSNRVRRRFISVAAAAALVLALGVIFYVRGPQLRGMPNPINSIAVLPFKVIGNEVDKQKLGVGLADAVINQFGRLGPLEVRPTSTVIPYADRPELDSVAAGRMLGVDVVLEGTLQRDGDRAKVSVQLLDVADGRSLWAETFYANAADTFGVEDVFAERIATELSMRLSRPDEPLVAEP